MKFLFILIINTPYFFYLKWKDKPKQKNKSFCYLYKFYMIYLWFILIISIMAIGIFSLGVLAVRGEKLTSGFFVLSFLGIVLFSFYIFSILKEIKELKQIKGKWIDRRNLIWIVFIWAIHPYLEQVTKKLLKFEKWVYFERFKSPKTLLNQGYKI